MIEKVILQMNGDSKFQAESGKPCGQMNPKELLLYAAALCAGHTAMTIMQKERITPKRLEISYAGELSTETLLPESIFRSFHVIYNVECATEDDQAKVSRAIELTHEKYCGLTQMLRRIAPVSHETAVVSTQTEPMKA